MKGIKVMIFNSEYKTEDEINEFIKDKDVVDIKHATAGEGGFNRDSTLIIYKKEKKVKDER